MFSAQYKSNGKSNGKILFKDLPPSELGRKNIKMFRSKFEKGG